MLTAIEHNIHIILLLFYLFFKAQAHNADAIKAAPTAIGPTN